MVRLLAVLSLLLLTYGSKAQTALDQVPIYGDVFGQGINFGWYQNWTDDDLARLATGSEDGRVPGIGVNVLRPGLFAWFLEQHGYQVRHREFAAYRGLGATQNVAIMGFPSHAQRGEEQWCAGSRSRLFKGMWEPIWDDGSDGTPYNEDNTYAEYMYKAVQNYGNEVRIWEIWNEPDINYSGNGWKDRRFEGNWFDNDIDPCELQIQAPVQAYVRMLRISYEIIKRLQPDDYVAIGGIGFPSFLDAVLRSTDEPTSGAVSSAYPLKGGAYFDVLSFHVYPHLEEGFRTWNNNRGQWDWKRHSDAAVAGVYSKVEGFREVLTAYGFDGSQYPEMVFICTESNLPRQPMGEEAAARSTIEMQRNFILKILARCKQWDVVQFHPYQLADHASEASAGNEFDLMGFYKFINDSPGFDQVQRTETGIAYKTYGDLLKGAVYSDSLSAALQMPAGTVGLGFYLPDDQGRAFAKTAYILWAETREDGNEYPRVNYTVRGELTQGRHRSLKWNFSLSRDHRPIPATLELTGEPTILMEASGLGTSSNVNQPKIDQQLSIWPNPAREKINVQLPQSEGSWKLEIFDMLGRPTGIAAEVQAAEEGLQVVLESDGLSAGTYMLQAANGQQVLSQAVVIY